ncbi:MAG: PKD domain-containing protein, partial [Planctomycetales bacterium]|nr:PKD domain-containing protein [Planctomycetales bacterium]
MRTNLYVGALSVIEAGAAQRAIEGSQVTVSATLGNPSLPLAVSWSLQTVDGIFLNGGNGSSFTFTPPDQGHYLANFVARNTETNVEYSDRRHIFVDAAPLTFNLGAAVSMSEGLFSRHIEFNDPGIETYDITIDYGDGTQAQIVDYNLPFFDLDHTYRDPGLYQLSMTVANHNAAEQSDEPSLTRVLPITVSRLQPTVLSANFTGPVSEGIPAVLSVWIEDPTWVIATPNNGWSVRVEWGDGHSQTVSPVTLVSGVLPIPHTYADEGAYNIDITVVDEDGDVGMFQTNIQVLNVVPSTLDEASQLHRVNFPSVALEGQSIVFTADARDPGDDELTYLWAFSDGVNLSGANVTRQFLTSGTTPQSFTLTVSDDDGGVQPPLTYQLTVENVSPALAPTVDRTVKEGTTILFDPIAVISDPAMLTETYSLSIDWGDGSFTTLASAAMSASGAFSASHAFPDDGQYTVRLRATDSDGGSSDDEIAAGDLDGNAFVVTVENSAPVIAPIVDLSISEGIAVTLNASFTDPAGIAYSNQPETESFTYSIDWGDGSQPTSGNVTNVQFGLAGQSLTSGTISQSHTYHDNGTYRATLTVTDDDAGVGSARFVVNVSNVAPQLTVDSTAPTTLVGQPFVVTGTYSDVSGDSVVVYVDVGDGQPRRAVLDNGTFRFAHAFEQAGSVTLIVSGQDENTGTTTQSIALQVVAEASVVVTTANTHPENSSTPYALSLSSYSALPGTNFVAAVVNWGDGSSTRLSPTDFTAFTSGGNFLLQHIYSDDGAVAGRAMVSVNLLRPDNSTYTAWLQGLEILNVAPTGSVTNSGPAAVGGVATVTLSNVFDPSNEDLANLRVSFDFNNNGDYTDVGDRLLVSYSQLQSAGGVTVPVPNSVLSTAGAHNIRVRLSDDDGGSVDLLTVLHVGIDNLAPHSSVASLPTEADALAIPIYVNGSDPTSAGGMASGVLEYELYVSVDAGNYKLFATVPAILPATLFQAQSNHTYLFRSVARDRAGNVEQGPVTADTQIHVGDLDPPVTRVDSATASSSGLFSVHMSGSEFGGGQLRLIDLYVVVDGGAAELIGSSPAGTPDASGRHVVEATYQGRADGQPHSYRFFSIGRDSLGNIESAPTKSSDVIVNATFAATGLQ